MYIEDPGETLVRVPRGSLGLKNTPFGAVKKVNMYVFLVVFHSAELKFKCFNT